MSVADVYELPAGRVLFADEQGRVLRATWHLEHRLVNLSVWRDDRCTETFRLSLGDAAGLVAFLVDGLSDATGRLLHAVGDSPTPTVRAGRRAVWSSRLRLSRTAVAEWIRPAE